MDEQSKDNNLTFDRLVSNCLPTPLHLLKIKFTFLPIPRTRKTVFQLCTTVVRHVQSPPPLAVVASVRQFGGWFSRLSTRQVLSKTGFQTPGFRMARRPLMYADGHRAWKRGCSTRVCHSHGTKDEASRTGADRGTARSNGVPPDDPRNPETR